MFKCMFWNFQGAANALFGRNLKMFLPLHKSNIVILMETRISDTKADDVIQKNGDLFFSGGVKGFV